MGFAYMAFQQIRGQNQIQTLQVQRYQNKSHCMDSVRSNAKPLFRKMIMKINQINR